VSSRYLFRTSPTLSTVPEMGTTLREAQTGRTAGDMIPFSQLLPVRIERFLAEEERVPFRRRER
jgi:hypothetical protein